MNETEREDKRAELATIREKFSATQEEAQAKLKEHIEMFNDAVIAIISTVMILEVPLPVSGGSSYGGFLRAILVFLTSFFIVANFWYSHHWAMGGLNFSKKSTLILNFVFLASLSLIPLLTKWLMQEPTRLAVMNYGAVYLVVNIIEGIIIGQSHYDLLEEHPSALQLTRKILVFRLVSILLWNIFLIGTAYFIPNIVMVLYISLPIINFLWPFDKQPLDQGRKNKRVHKIRNHRPR